MITQTSATDRRLSQARQHYFSCSLCEHRCHANRQIGERGPCKAGREARVYLHRVEYSEEAELIPAHLFYLSGCDLRCIFCIQELNAFDPRRGQALTPDFFQEAVAWGQVQGARTLEWLGGEPTIHLPAILEAMASCSTLPPVIWKSDFYFTPETLELLNGAVDIYLPDFKFGNNSCARKLAGVENYIDVITRNLERAADQGDMIVRHLLLPGHFDCCYRPIVDWVGKHLPDTKFHPPRARPWVKRFRRLVPIDRASHRFRERATGLREQATLVAGTVRIPVPTWDVLFRLIVPGWAHSTLGFEVRGRVFLGIYLALLLPGIIMWGSVPGSILLGLAFSTHASSVLDVLLLRAGPFPSRFGTTTIVMFVLGFFIYAPVYWLVTHVASPMTIATQMTPLEAGDIVLSNQWAYARTPPKPGDVVAYDLPTEIRMPAQNNHIGINVRSGQSIDRILAGPGSKVRWENQQLYVDDEPSSLQPLNPTRLPSRLTFEVPENHYLVLPSTATVTLPANAVLPAGFWQGLSYISPTHIHGSVYLRHYPLWRFWIVR